MEPHDFFTALAAWTGCLTEAIFSVPFPWFFHIRETIILLPCPIALWKYWKCEWKTRLYTLRRSEVSPEGETVTVSLISLQKTLYSQWQIDCVSMEGWYVTRFLLSREVIQRVFPDAMFIATATTSLAAFKPSPSVSCLDFRRLNNGFSMMLQLHLMPFPVS